MLGMNVTSETENADLSASRPHDLSDSMVSYTGSLGGRGPGLCPLGCLLTLSPDSAPVSCLSVHPFTSLSHFLHLRKRKRGAAALVASFCGTRHMAEVCLADVGIGVPSSRDEM